MWVILEQGPSGSITTIDNRVGKGQGRVAATYCINYCIVFLLLVPVNRDEDATVSCASLTQ
jgi:hypothetical protein